MPAKKSSVAVRRSSKKAPKVDAILPSLRGEVLPVSVAHIDARGGTGEPAIVNIEVCGRCSHIPFGGPNMMLAFLFLLILTLSAVLMVASEIVSVQNAIIASLPAPQDVAAIQ